MPLDTIAVPATRVGGYSPLKALAAAQTNVEADRKERERVAEEQDRAMIQQVMQQTPEDPDTAIKTLKQRGFFGAATGLQKIITEQRTKAAAQRKGEIDNEIATTKLVSEIFGGAATPEAWAVAQQRLKGIDPKVDALIQQPFNPAVATQLMNGARTEEERLKALKLAIERQDLDAWRAAMAADPEGVEAEQAGNMLMGPQVIATLKGQAEGREIQREGQQVTREGQATSAATALSGQQNAAAIAAANRSNAAAIAAANREAANARAANALAAQKAGAGPGGVKLSATSIQKVAAVDQARGILSSIEKLLPNMADAIGPIDQYLTKAKIATGKGATTDLATFDAQIQSLHNNVIQATTGAQMSEPEAKRILNQVPNLGNSPTVFKARMATTRNNLETLKRRIIELSSGNVEGSAPSGATVGGYVVEEEE